MFVTAKTVKRVERKRVASAKKPRPNYFDRVKTIHGGKTWEFLDKRSNNYFDCETYMLYTNPEDPSELPKIVPYLIGTCTDEIDSYKVFLGHDSAIKFFDYIWSSPSSDEGTLCAFNIDYDFHSIRPFIVEKYHKDIRISYEMTDNKKFIFGNIQNRHERRGKDKATKLNLRLVDLWRWNTLHSLKSYIQHILDLIYDKEGNLKNDDIGVILHKKMTQWGFTRESFKKLQIDPVKINLHQRGDKWYYYSTKQDWIDDTNLKELDLEHELKYLKIDVTSLPIVHLEQHLMRRLAKKNLGIGNPIDPDRTITAPGFAKYLCEEYEQKYMTETYRFKVPVADYKLMLSSYTGAFVGGNQDITYLDEQIFKQLYPNKSFFDKSGKPIIKSYDVNSMYPWAMSLGLPFGPLFHVKPKCKHIVWYEVHFEDYIDPKNKIIYKWKKKYSYLNNSFFGDRFEIGLVPGVSATNKVYILKELYDLFISMNDAKCHIAVVRYQRVSTELTAFVDTLYKIKRNDDGRHPDSTVSLVKLLLNSLYGKMAEKYKDEKVQWAIDCDTFILNHPELLTELKSLGVKTLDDEAVKNFKFKQKISPYIDLTNDCGFFFVENKDKRFDEEGNDCRESITAGIFITSISRWKLLSTVKGEIDQGNIVLYCDTDSIKLIEFKDPKFECHNKDLGAWKYEGSFYYFGHPNKLKKYFMHNPYETNPKLRWMVKTSGVNVRHLKNPEGDFDLETIKTLYDPNNRVLITKSKPTNKRNDWYQTVISDSDFKFVFENTKDPETHILDKGILTKLNV